MDIQAKTELQQRNLEKPYHNGIAQRQRSFVTELIRINESRNGIPRDRHTMKLLLQWVHRECQLRWADISKQRIMDVVNSIDGYHYEVAKK